MRVLLAEDHPIVRRGIRALLESQGYEVCAETSDGRAAAECAGHEKPDVAILDYMMPQLNGIEAARQIRDASPTTQILMFTQYDDEDLVREALQAGARAFVNKSEADEHLLQALSALVQGRSYFSSKVSDAMLASFVDHSGGASPKLTPREREVVQLIAEAHNSKDIANVLNVSVKTVDTHRGSAIRKLGVKNVSGLVRYAMRHRMIQQ
jgi:DNA-binding NarL/FixJ family response regulator